MPSIGGDATGGAREGNDALAAGRARATVICLHETGATAAAWDGLVGAAEGAELRVVAYDRLGWGANPAPENYTRTTIGEQAQEALGKADELELEQAVFCGAGFGAVAALDLAVREPGRVSAAVLIEPPLLALLPEATEGLSADVKAMRDAAEAGGVRAAAELYASGALSHIGPVAARAARREVGEGPAVRHPISLLAEISAVPAWTLPLPELAALEVPVAVVTAPSTPPLLRRAADVLAARTSSAERIEMGEEVDDPLAGPALFNALNALG